MNSCNSINLITYLEGEDSDGKLEAHLKECKQCQKELNTLKKLLDGIVTIFRTETTYCSQKKTAIKMALGEIEPDVKHFDDCLECRGLYTTITESLRDVENKTSTSHEPLPEFILEQVAARKKKWMSDRLRKVFDFQGIKEEKEQETHIKKLLEEKHEALPRAAFPDDLAGSKSKGKDEEDSD